MKCKNMYNKKIKIFYLCISLIVLLDALFEMILSISLLGGLFRTNSFILSILFHSFLVIITSRGIFCILKNEIVVENGEIKFYDFSKIWVTRIYFNEIERIYAVKNTEVNNYRYENDSVVINILSQQKKYTFSVCEKDFQKLIKETCLLNLSKNTGDGTMIDEK